MCQCPWPERHHYFIISRWEIDQRRESDQRHHSWRGFNRGSTFTSGEMGQLTPVATATESKTQMKRRQSGKRKLAAQTAMRYICVLGTLAAVGFLHAIPRLTSSQPLRPVVVFVFSAVLSVAVPYGSADAAFVALAVFVRMMGASLQLGEWICIMVTALRRKEVDSKLTLRDTTVRRDTTTRRASTPTTTTPTTREPVFGPRVIRPQFSRVVLLLVGILYLMQPAQAAGASTGDAAGWFAAAAAASAPVAVGTFDKQPCSRGL
jgi:hypothetical protein